MFLAYSMTMRIVVVLPAYLACFSHGHGFQAGNSHSSNDIALGSSQEAAKVRRWSSRVRPTSSLRPFATLLLATTQVAAGLPTGPAPLRKSIAWNRHTDLRAKLPHAVLASGTPGMNMNSFSDQDHSQDPTLGEHVSQTLRRPGWSGSTSASVDIPEVPVDKIYIGYADLTRMTEWSPALESVTVDEANPMHSVWSMKVPRGLGVAAKLLGYPSVRLSWEADLEAPGPPLMSWTSTLNEDGSMKGMPNAGFEPSGSLLVEQKEPGVSTVTLTLKYALPETAPAWQIELVKSSLVQYIIRSRIRAGLVRFSKAMQQEWEALKVASGSSGSSGDMRPQ